MARAPHDPAMPRVTSPRLIGRGPELAALASAYRRAESGELSVVLLGGEAGIGKTRLVEEHVAAIRAAGGRVLIGECVQVGETSLPYGPFIDALGSGALPGSLPGAAAASWGATGTADGPSEPSAFETSDRLGAQASLFAAVAAGLGALADEQPVLLVVEDIHWADPASRDLLVYVVRRLRKRRIQVVATFRTDALHRRHPLMPFLAETRRWPFAERIEPARLDLPAVVELIGELVGEPPSRAVIERVFTRSEGVPFFVESLVADDGRASVDGGTVAWEILGQRLAALSPGGLRVLGASAVLGRRVDHDLLLEVAGEAPDVVMSALRELAEANLLVPARHGPAGAYEFRHALIQEVAYDELLPAERAALHRCVAEHLARGVDLAGEVPMAIAGEIAHHAERAHDLALALDAADAAGRAATANLAFTDADRHFAAALALWAQVHGDAATSELAALVGRAALAAGYANQPARAARYDRRALELATTDEERSAILHELFWHLWDAGEIDDLLATAERALRLVPGRSPTGPGPSPSPTSGSLAGRSARTTRPRLLRERRWGSPMRSPTLGSRATRCWCSGWRSPGRVARAWPTRSSVRRSTTSSPAVTPTARRAWRTGGPTRSSSTALRAGARDRRSRGWPARPRGVDVRHGDALRAVIAENLEHLGRWDEALAVSADGFNWGSNQPSELWSHAVHARIAVCRGQLDVARRQLEAADRVQAAGPDRIWQAEEVMGLAYAVGEVDLARARLADGIRRRRRRSGRCRSGGCSSARSTRRSRSPCTRGRRATATALPRRSDRPAGARTCSTRTRRRPSREVARGRSSMPSRCGRRRFEPVSRDDRTRPPGGPSSTVSTRWVPPGTRHSPASDWRRRSSSAGPRDEAAPVLAAARTRALELGTTPLLGEIERLARAAGIDLGADEARGPADEGPTALDRSRLSTRELEVLTLVAAGRTNREIGEALFISPKTASVHVTHILEKLGVSSRVEAALLASRAGMERADGSGVAGA